MANQILILEVTIAAEEKQRREIGAELHDNINQLLATTKLYLTMAANNDNMQKKMLKQGLDTLMQAMNEIRNLAGSLVALQVKEESLQNAVNELVDSLQQGLPFAIEIIYEEAIEDELSQSRKLMFYRILQEQLHNIIKYANPTDVTIRFGYEEQNIFLSIKDNGAGFNTRSKSKGIGLKNMKNRAEMENGSLIIKSSEGYGCEVIASVPVPYGVENITGLAQTSLLPTLLN